MKALIYVIIIVVISICFYNLGKNNGQGNQVLNYGSSGFPKNCRALIAENIDGYKTKVYSADEALYSIERNCGRNGYIWNER